MNEEISVESLPTWTEAERWVWEQVSKGNEADFNEYLTADRRHCVIWSERRRISGAFLETILLEEPYRSSLTRKGVKISGAWFLDAVDLSNSSLTCELALRNCRFDSAANFSGLRSSWPVSFDRSMFSSVIDFSLSDLTILVLRESQAKEVRLNHARLQDVDLERHVASSGNLNMNSLRAIGSLFLNEISIASINLVHATVGGGVEMSGITCTGNLQLNAITVGSSVYINDGSQVRDLSLRRATIEGNLEMDRISCVGTNLMDWANVGSNIFLREGRFAGPIKLNNTRVANSLDLSGAELATVDMTGIQIQGELRLGTGATSGPLWSRIGELILRNGFAKTVQDSNRDSDWPARMDLGGFTYRQLGGFRDAERWGEMSARPATWFLKNWFNDPIHLSQQSYSQLASVLRQAGYVAASKDILMAGCEVDRMNSPTARKLALLPLKWTIGYGFRFSRSVGWVLVLTILGAAVKASLHVEMPLDIAGCLVFSLDLLLPILTLDERHTIDFHGWQKYYFYLHRLLGFFLGSYVVAGIAGVLRR